MMIFWLIGVGLQHFTRSERNGGPAGSCRAAAGAALTWAGQTAQVAGRDERRAARDERSQTNACGEIRLTSPC